MAEQRAKAMKTDGAFRMACTVSVTIEARADRVPMIKGSLPDFAPVFERYAEDLRRAAEDRAE
jgi:hypothetical protein